MIQKKHIEQVTYFTCRSARSAGAQESLEVVSSCVELLNGNSQYKDKK